MLIFPQSPQPGLFIYVYGPFRPWYFHFVTQDYHCMLSVGFPLQCFAARYVDRLFPLMCVNGNSVASGEMCSLVLGYIAERI